MKKFHLGGSNGIVETGNAIKYSLRYLLRDYAALVTVSRILRAGIIENYSKLGAAKKNALTFMRALNQ